MSATIAQVSDLHFSEKNLAESTRVLRTAIDGAIAAQADGLIVTGDSTDHAMQMQNPAVRALAAEIQRAAQHMPVLLLQGTFSHEPPGFLRLLALMGSKYPISVADRISSWCLEGGRFVPLAGTSIPRVAVHALPSMNKADVAAMAEGDAHETAHSLIAQVLRSWAPVNQALRAKGVPSIVISHGTVLNSVSEHGVPMAGTDHEYTLGDLYAAEADAVMLGHIHLHQHWQSDALGFPQTIAYAGSLGRFYYGEQGDKYWLLWNMVAGETSFKANATPSRRNIEIDFEGVPDLDALVQRAGDFAGAYVRVRYEVDSENTQAVSHAAIRAALDGAAEVHIERTTLTIQRERVLGISTASLPEKLRIWCDKTATPDCDGLQTRLSQIETDSPAAIAAQLIGRLRQEVAQHAPEPAQGFVGPAPQPEPAPQPVAPVVPVEPSPKSQDETPHYEDYGPHEGWDDYAENDPAMFADPPQAESTTQSGLFEDMRVAPF